MYKDLICYLQTSMDLGNFIPLQIAMFKIKIETEILESYANKQTMILISLDLQKAYDTVRRHRVLKILSKWHINGQMLQFIISFHKEYLFK